MKASIVTKYRRLSRGNSGYGCYMDTGAMSAAAKKGPGDDDDGDFWPEQCKQD